MHDDHDTTPDMSREALPYSRRLFIRQGIALASLSATVPWFVQRSAGAAMLPEGSLVASRPGVREERVLVVVQLGGGNDGLNTVVPYGLDAYHRARPVLGLKPPRETGGALELDAARGLGLHPNLEGLKDLHDRGRLAILQGVGYPNPNRSHFTSMDIWHSASPTSRGRGGWLGRYFDHACAGRPEPEAGVAIGREAPLAMLGDETKPITFETEELFRWSGSDLHPLLAARYGEASRIGRLDGVPEDSQLAFLTRTALDAQVSSDRIRAAVAKPPLVRYPQGNLARQLQMVAAMIRDGLRTRVYYVSLGGFDTHAGQAGTHGNLLRQVGGSLQAFQADLEAQGNDGRVVTMVFSEFGRRVRQNASGGTDHGAAAPMFLVGSTIRPGVLGEHPSLEDLDDGDLRFGIDFRSVYAGLLEDWLDAPSAAVLGGTFRKASLLRT